MKKNSWIEVYRFIAAMAMVSFHIISNNESGTASNQRLIVEFFFILSGFLLMNHCERHPEESPVQTAFGKLKSFYAEFLIVYVAAAVVRSCIKRERLILVVYDHLHQLLFITNALDGKTSALTGTGQLWFILSQVWATLILAWLIQNRKKEYKSFWALMIALTGYVVVLRCSGNLTTNVYWKIANEKIYLPLRLIRALAGMATGTIVYMIYKKLSAIRFTRLAQKGGAILSAMLMLFSLWLSARPKERAINSFGWHALLIVLIYAGIILLTFVFAGDLPQNSCLKKLFDVCGRWSLPIYMTHTLVIYLVKTARVPYGKRYFVLVYLGTAAASVVLKICAGVLKKVWNVFRNWLWKMCVAQPAK